MPNKIKESASTIKCKNIVKIRFNEDQIYKTEVNKHTTKNKESMEPNLHPSISKENLKLKTKEHEQFSIEVTSQPSTQSFKPSKMKQLNDIQLLLDQYYKYSYKNHDFIYIIDSLWIKNWLDWIIDDTNNIESPGSINNWNLIDLEDPLYLESISNKNKNNTSARHISSKDNKGLSFDGEEFDFIDTIVETPTNSNEIIDEYNYISCKYILKKNLKHQQRYPFGNKKFTIPNNNNNNNMIDYCKYIILNQDYYLIPYEAWSALHTWYGGGPPLPRCLFHTLKKPHSTLNTASSIIPCVLISWLNHIQSMMKDDLISTVEPLLPQQQLTTIDLVDYEEFQLENFDIYPPITQLQSVQDMLDYIANPHPSLNPSSSLFTSVASMSNFLHQSSYSSMSSLQGIHNSQISHTNTSDTIQIESQKEIFIDDICHVCRRIAKQRCSNCSSIFYCSRDCQRIHWKYHRLLCDTYTQRKATYKNNNNTNTTTNNNDNNTTTANISDSIPLFIHDRGGKMGLNNLGNSCYMNSSLQCLSHIKPLTIAILSKRILKDVNITSKDGTGGKLLEYYSKLLEVLWFEGINKRNASPHELKGIIGKINLEYAGLAQQDAHELIELLLDKLHEDLNRVKSKPYTLKIEGNGTNDDEIAKNTWRNDMQRDDSIIRDLMGGLMRSQLTCIDCHKVSVSYEYHATLQIAIPRSNLYTIKVIFIPEITSMDEINKIILVMKNNNEIEKLTLIDKIKYITIPVIIDIKIDRLSTIFTLKQALKSKIPTYYLQNSSEEIILLESALNGHSVSKFVRDTTVVSKLTPDSIIFAYCPPYSAPHYVLLLQRIIQPSSTFYTSNNNNNKNNKNNNNCNYYNNNNDNNDKVCGNNIPFNPIYKQLWDSLLEMKLTGIPLLISYQKQWTCNRLRYSVFLNTIRFINTTSNYGIKLYQTLNSNLSEHFKYSNLLDIRYINLDGQSLNSVQFDNLENKNEVHLKFQNISKNMKNNNNNNNNDNYDILYKKEWLSKCYETIQNTFQIEHNNQYNYSSYMLFGTDLSNEKSIKIEEFGGVMNTNNGNPSNCATTRSNAIFMMSLDLYGDILEAYDFTMIKSLLPTTIATVSSQYNHSGVNKSVIPPNNGFTLYECLDEYTKEEVLDAGNEVYCSVCEEHKAATKIVKFCKQYLPKILIITLKRFEFRDISNLGMYASAHREKIDTFVDFPIDNLNLSSYCHTNNTATTTSTRTTTSSTTTTYNNNNNNNTIQVQEVDSIYNNGMKYNLFAVCNHYGRLGFGHYTAAARDWNRNQHTNTTTYNNTATATTNNNYNNSNMHMNNLKYKKIDEQWYSYDDDTVTGPCTFKQIEEEVHSKNAYILFYRRIDVIDDYYNSL